MKKSKFLFLAVASALSLTGCDFINDLIRDDSSVSDEEIPTNNGLYSYTNDGSEFGCDTHNPTYSASGVKVSANTKDTYERVGKTTWTVNFPSTGSPRILVIPVELRDYTSTATDKVRSDIYKTFFGKSEETGWESVSSFYYKSSFGKLNIQGAVSEWYDCGYTSKQLARLTSSDSSYDPTWTILENAVKWYKSTYSSSGVEFDTNHDGFFDAVWLVYGAPNAQNDSSMDSNTYWAYTYFDNSVFDNIKYQCDLDKLKTNPVGYHYAWASYDFMYEGYGKNKRDAHTFIHETGHLLGLDDYYVSTDCDDYTRNYGPTGWVDMMDANVIDHNSFSKFALGWVSPYVVSSSCTVELKPMATSGEFLILPTSGGWNGMAFDEYMILEYYTPEGLNASDSESAYSNGVQGMTNKGIRIWHIDARLVELDSNSNAKRYVDSFSDDDAVYQANSNTAYYNMVNGNVGNLAHRLIQLIDCGSKKNYDTEYDSSTKQAYMATNSSLFTAGKTFSYSSYAKSFPSYYFNSKSTMNDGTSLPWSVTVNSISNEKAVLTITKA